MASEPAPNGMTYKQWLFGTLLVAVVGGVCTIAAAAVGLLGSGRLRGQPTSTPHQVVAQQTMTQSTEEPLDRQPATPEPTPTRPPSNTPTQEPVAPAKTAEPLPEFESLVENASALNFRGQSDLPEVLRQGVSAFLGNAAWYEIQAYRNANSVWGSYVYADRALANLERNISGLTASGVFGVPEIDYQRSHVVEVRPLAGLQLEVDACEYWRVTYYALQTGLFVEQQPAAPAYDLVPQTLLLEFLSQAGGSSWYVTDIEFYDPPAFCG